MAGAVRDMEFIVHCWKVKGPGRVKKTFSRKKGMMG